MSPFDQLIEAFRKFPGIGPRQAKRFVYHLIRLSEGDAALFSENILKLKKSMRSCAGCKRYFASDRDEQFCSICRNPNRDKKVLMVIAHDNDLEVVEKSGSFKGNYFVLGGTVPILEQVPSYIKTEALVERIKKLAADGLEEIIIAMSVTMEGEHTASYLKNTLTPHLLDLKKPITLSILGRGVSTGSELEYADKDTIASALSGRKQI